jgi:ATP-binding cassette, subfamily F, member 3
LGYFEDDSNDFSRLGIYEFFQPILESADINDSEIEDICDQLGSLNVNQKSTENIKLEEKIQMDSGSSSGVNISRQRIGDIRHGMSNRGPAQTTVDQKKLRNQERKIEENRKARGTYNGEVIPEWNPEKAPSMVVNQAKRAPDTKSKDIKVEDFDIQFAGKKILQNANLTLAFGRRYGLVGKNGVGKSTLLRAIANKELQIPSHIRVLHVEQEVVSIY